MTDYGHDLVFGALLNPADDEGPSRLIELAQLMESENLDLVSLMDHPYWPERLDTLLQLANVAAHTSRIKLAVNVANLPLRPPAMLARQAMTLSQISEGRFNLGLGAGSPTFQARIVADGGPVRDARQSVEALEEAVQLIRQLWIPGQQVRFHGRHYHLDGAQSGQGAVRHIDIWLGVYKSGALRATGRLADGWVPSSPYLGPDELDRANSVIDEAAVRSGRRPEAIRRIYNIAGTFSATGTGFLQGPPRVWTEQLTELALSAGVSGFLLYLLRSADDIRRFAREVAPAVRESVAKERTQPRRSG
jgi:alkanesulfonate monooxygenase SsuD/methylene tetrahydromethanopterin reductase-like flavin-dependent oxidoreductase (luciferase family)